MYQSGADVVYHAAGGSGGGLFQAAKEHSESSGTHVWAIGVDSDQVPDGRRRIPATHPHLDAQEGWMWQCLRRSPPWSTTVSEGGYRTFDLSVDGVGYATSGGHVDDIAGQLEDLKDQVISGAISVPESP